MRTEYDPDDGWPITVSAFVRSTLIACALLTVAWLGVIAFVVVFGS